MIRAVFLPLAGLVALTGAVIPGWAVEPITIRTGQSEIVFEAESAFPSGWMICSPTCGSDSARKVDFLDRKSTTGFFRPVVLDDPAATLLLQQLRYTAELERSIGGGHGVVSLGVKPGRLRVDAAVYVLELGPKSPGGI